MSDYRSVYFTQDGKKWDVWATFRGDDLGYLRGLNRAIQDATWTGNVNAKIGVAEHPDRDTPPRQPDTIVAEAAPFITDAPRQAQLAQRAAEEEARRNAPKPEPAPKLSREQALERAHAARLEKAYAKKYRFSGGVHTLREYLKINPPVSKHIYIQTHAERRIHLSYAELQTPKKHYHVSVVDGDREFFYEVPKIVWDDLNIPLRVSGS